MDYKVAKKKIRITKNNKYADVKFKHIVNNEKILLVFKRPIDEYKLYDIPDRTFKDNEDVVNYIADNLETNGIKITIHELSKLT